MSKFVTTVLLTIDDAEYQFEILHGSWVSVGDSERLGLDEITIIRDALLWLNETMGDLDAE